MTGLRAGALVAAGVALVLAGCGGDGDAADDAPAPPIVVDAALRQVLARAPEDAREGVRFAPTARILARPLASSDLGTLLVASTGFPVWNDDDGVRHGRVVATDRVVLVTGAGGSGTLRRLPRHARVGIVAAPSVEGASAADALGRLEDDSAVGPAVRRARGVRGVPLVSGQDARDALAGGRVAAALVPRSALGPRVGALTVVRLDLSTAPRALYQVGTKRESPVAHRLRAWLAGPDGQGALRAAGFAGPGAHPTPERGR